MVSESGWLNLRRSAVLSAAIAALTLGAAHGPAQAHPHVWINADVTLVFESKAIRTLEITWAFDDLYSTLIREDFDKNGDGTLDESELAEVARNQLEENLGEFSYFTHLQIDGERLRVTEVEAFRAHFKDELLSFTFRVPLAEPVDPTKTDFAFGLYDEEYYIEFGLRRDEPIQMSGEAPGGCKSVVGFDQENPIYFGAVTPMRISLSCNVG